MFLIIAIFLFMVTTLGVFIAIFHFFPAANSLSDFAQSFSGAAIIGLIVAIPFFYILAFCFWTAWREERRDKIMRKIQVKTFLESGRTLSWYEQKILGRHIVEKILSGELLRDLETHDRQTENALGDMAEKHRRKPWKK